MPYIHRTAGSIAALLCAVATLAAPPSAHAQRGAAFVEQAAAPAAPQSGFPGLFDTEMARRGGVVAEVPWLSLSYGVTDNLTVGTNLWAALPSAWGAPSALLMARYRHFSSERVSSVLTAYAGYARVDALADDGKEGRAFILFGTSNTTVRLGRRHALTFTGLAGRFGLRIEDADIAGLYEGGSLTAVGVAASHQLDANDWLGIQTTVVALPVLIGAMDSTSESATVDFGDASAADLVLARLLFQLRAGRSWLFTAGAAAQFTEPAVLPWLGAARRW